VRYRTREHLPLNHELSLDAARVVAVAILTDDPAAFVFDDQLRPLVAGKLASTS
jgi:hypothetical protein